MSLLNNARSAYQRLTAPKARRKRTGSEVAWGGAPLLGGMVLDDHLLELRGQRASQTATKMRRTDGQVRSVEKVISLPIRSTVWLIQPPDKASAEEKSAAEALEQNLFGGMETSWDDLLREACLAIYYGFRIPEIIWEERAGMVCVQRIASRNPELVERWLYDEEGQLLGFLYAGSKPRGSGLEQWSSQTNEYERLPIPLEKTLHFVYDQEGDNPQGFGLWRSMYPHYYIKQAIYKILSIGIERNLLGTPYAKLPGGTSDPDKNAVLNILRKLRAAEDGAFTLPDGIGLEWFESARSLVDAMPFLSHHDAKIAQVALAQFLNLGQAAVGTQAIGTVHVDVFERAEDANARWIEQTINAQLVKRWYAANGYPDDFRRAAVSHKPIKSQDLLAWGQTLTALIGGGLLHGTPEDEEFVRDTMELPAIPLEQLQTLEQQRQKAEADAAKEQPARPGQQDNTK